MYNMEIRVELIILLGFIFLIIVSHTLCGCCKFGFLEGLETLKSEVTLKKKKTDLNKNVSSSQMTSGKKEGFI